MSEAPTPAHPAIAMLARETRLREGTAPREIGGVTVGPGKQRLFDDCFIPRAVPDTSTKLAKA
ncbi:hypothetical protein [Novosphingobium sp.]|uniref:hypothetical protein n=1 Tax=Novosphingobium sp. TaxID=1874826 RepID=UPI002732C227|nr:hypothetical protein [Novosphingobium sp.]MDP3907598.1 hypothetical protein [Novosphingobium sp.]